MQAIHYQFNLNLSRSQKKKFQFVNETWEEEKSKTKNFIHSTAVVINANSQLELSALDALRWKLKEE